jgi:hypothetical protein
LSNISGVTSSTLDPSNLFPKFFSINLVTASEVSGPNTPSIPFFDNSTKTAPTLRLKQLIFSQWCDQLILKHNLSNEAVAIMKKDLRRNWLFVGLEPDFNMFSTELFDYSRAALLYPEYYEIFDLSNSEQSVHVSIRQLSPAALNYLFPKASM